MGRDPACLPPGAGVLPAGAGTWLKLAVMLGGLLWLLVQGAADSGYHWQWYRVPRYLFTTGPQGFQAGPLLEGLGVSLKICAVSLGLAFALGLLGCVLRLSSSPVGRGLARGYVWLIRNTPLLIQIFLVYFVLGPILELGRLTAAIWALSLFEGAYVLEILRAGVESVERGQWEAAFSLGLNRRQAYRHVILPQAVPRVLPPLTSQAINLLKDSALVSAIAVYDLTMRAQAVIADTYLTFEVWLTVAAIYFALALCLSLAADLVARAAGRAH